MKKVKEIEIDCLYYYDNTKIIIRVLKRTSNKDIFYVKNYSDGILGEKNAKFFLSKFYIGKKVIKKITLSL